MGKGLSVESLAKENDQGTMKHITLSTNRPEATDPGQIFKDWKDDKKNTGYMERQQAMILLQEYARAYEREMKFDMNRFNMKLTSNIRTDTVEDRTPAIGSAEEVYSNQDKGFFESVLMAYNHHWNLRTSPEDWWFCVIRRIALAIDENSKKDSVRKMFVEHEGKEKLTVAVPVMSIYDVDYPSFFDAMAKEISRNVKVPEFVDSVTADFSTTTPVQRIVSQITLMSSMQEFFDYGIEIGCGIPAIEMAGTEEDWKKLLSKLKVLKTVLEPIEKDLGLTEKWWSLVKEIFSKLLETYRGSPNQEWWSHIISYKESFESGGPPTKYRGWMIEFLEGIESVGYQEIHGGLVTVPLKISFLGELIDEAALVAGMVGFTVHEGAVNKRLSIQPFQGWSLMLPENSPCRDR